MAVVSSEVELTVTGMTCGSCAARVERTLARQEGVERAAVNLATERAVVSFDPDRLGLHDLVAAVGKIGYGLAPATPAAATAAAAQGAVDVEAEFQAMWWRRVLVAWPLGLAVFVALRFEQRARHGEFIERFFERTRRAGVAILELLIHPA